MPTLEARSLRKQYRNKVAVEDVSVRVASGEIIGLLGPNGAGKSTLVKILITIVRPLRCEGSMLGKAVGTRDILSAGKEDQQA